eukprot:contig_8509_g1999
MSVLVIVGCSFGDTEVKTISTEEQTVTLTTGTVVRVLRDVPEEDPVSVQWNPVCDCLPTQSGKLYLYTKAKLKPGTVSYVPVTGTLQGHGLIEGHSKVSSQYEVHVAYGPGELEKGNPYYVQVMNPLNKEVRLRKGMVIASITPFEAPLFQAFPEELEALAAPRQVMEEPHAQMHMGEVPNDLRDQLMGLVEKYKSLWDGTLGLIKNTVHHIHLKPGITPVRQMPYKAGHRHLQREEDQMENMRKL